MGLFKNSANPYEQYSLGVQPQAHYSKREAEILAPQYLKQVRESVNLINSTVNPEVFFSRYGFALFRLFELSKMEGKVKFKGDKPSKFIKTMESEKQEAIKRLIDRICQKSREKCLSLKTVKAKENNIIKVESDLKLYLPELDGSSVDYLNAKISELKNFCLK